MVFMNDYAIFVKLNSCINDSEWVLTNVYGPCTSEGKRDFVHWLKHIQMPEEID